MEYYACAQGDLQRELSRRGHSPDGNHDRLSERLKYDDSERGSEATTVQNAPLTAIPELMRWKEDPVFGKTAQANLLVGERIVYWTTGTFFPTLQLFFASGLSCTIDGSELADAFIGLDPTLRHRLTDITHEEDGHLVNTIMAERFAANSSSIGILEATLAGRKSISVKNIQRISSSQPQTAIYHEVHLVVGLRLEGMKNMGYVWARVPRPIVNEGIRVWGHVRVAGLRKDVPVPFVGFPQKHVKPGEGATVVEKGSMINSERSKAQGPFRR
ncbi:hypothetical protein N0V90_012173 [Kalmusia sp. IMI 367209]|nr:hypothetical protein N0V90_012173 [Kalmusia sp. IMI 367209]